MALRLNISHATVTMIVVLATIAAACEGPTEQAKECTAGGAADEAMFAQHFSQMSFGNGEAPTGEGGQEFVPSESVVIDTVARTETATRFCAQERSRLGTVVYDREHSLPVGESRTDLGSFQEKADYVIRVSVGDVLVKNLAFTVR